MTTIEIKNEVIEIEKPKSHEISEIQHLNDINYNDFFINYMIPNLPVLVKNVSINWKCNEWIQDNRINIKILCQKFDKNHEVPVADCSKRYFDSHEKFQMKFCDFLNYWDGLENLGKDELNEKLYYLKDWHLKKEMPEYIFYEVPSIFASDWLNEYLTDVKKDDYVLIFLLKCL